MWLITWLLSGLFGGFLWIFFDYRCSWRPSYEVTSNALWMFLLYITLGFITLFFGLIVLVIDSLMMFDYSKITNLFKNRVVFTIKRKQNG